MENDQEGAGNVVHTPTNTGGSQGEAEITRA